MNLVKLRSMIGRSEICRPSNVVATSARSVLSSGASAVIVICSVTCPACSVTLTVEAVSTFTTTVSITVDLKLGASTLTRYVPGIRRVWVELPDALDLAVSLTLDPMLVIVTVAFGTAAPDESVTAPKMLPYTACPYVVATRARQNARLSASRGTLLVVLIDYLLC